MTRDDIIRMAKESDQEGDPVIVSYTWLERFAALVAAAEREACAKVCEEMYRRDGFAAVECEAADECAAAIRARGDK